MKNLIATGLIAAGLALSPMASTPAQAADAEDILGVIIGLGIIAAIANEIDDDKKSTRKKSTTHRRDYSHAPVIRRDYSGVGRHRVLPESCLRRLETRRGRIRTVAAERCLERRGVRTARLPNRCERVVETRRGLRDAFAARCLEREGYVFRR